MSAYVCYLDNKHEYGPMHTVAELIKFCEKSKILNCWDNFCTHHQRGQYPNRLNMIEHLTLFSSNG
jgi:hypothetical protein